MLMQGSPEFLRKGMAWCWVGAGLVLGIVGSSCCRTERALLLIMLWDGSGGSNVGQLMLVMLGVGAAKGA